MVSIFVISLVYILNEIKMIRSKTIRPSNILSIHYLLFFSFIFVLSYLLNWLALDNVALLESVVCAVFLGESSSIFDNAPPDPKDAENFLADLGDSSVLNS